jgi:hypothetical protein
MKSDLRYKAGSIFLKALGELGSEAPFFRSRPPAPTFHRKASRGVRDGVEPRRQGATMHSY